MARPSKPQVSSDEALSNASTSSEEEEQVNEQINEEEDDEELEAVARSASSDDDEEEVAVDNPPDSDEDPAAAEDGEDDEQVRIIFYSAVYATLFCSRVYTLLLILLCMFLLSRMWYEFEVEFRWLALKFGENVRAEVCVCEREW